MFRRVLEMEDEISVDAEMYILRVEQSDHQMVEVAVKVQGGLNDTLQYVQLNKTQVDMLIKELEFMRDCMSE